MEQGTKPKRKTFTSAEVKNRWNKAHYDKLTLICRKGGGDMIKSLAKEKGMSMSAYIVWLVRQDALNEGRTDVAEHLGGGGGNNTHP